MTIPPAPSAAPTNVSASAISSTALTVQWETVPCIEQNGDITGYTVRVLESGEMEFHSDFRGGKSRIVTNTYYVKSTMVLLVKRHIACPNRTDLCENYGP